MNELCLSQEEFELLREFIKSECGIAVGNEKSYLIETRLSRLVQEAGCESFGEFHDKARKDPRSGLRDKIVDAMTTNETLWFRDDGPWTILRKALLPLWCKKLQEGSARRIRIWSAAASTGQEPYSMLLTILEFIREQASPGVKAEAFEIVATDISPSALFVATAARYAPMAIKRGLDSDLRDRYFEKKGSVWCLPDEIKKQVKFHQFNLMDSYDRFGSFDLILCRNVLIYFSNDLKQQIYGKIAKSLPQGGCLVLGSAESMQPAFKGFATQRWDSFLYYQLQPEGKP